MDSSENQQLLHQSLTSKLKPYAFYLLSILILLLAVLIGFTKTNYYKIQHLRYIFSSPLTPVQTLFSLIHPTQEPKGTQTLNPITSPSYCILWMAPFLSGGGYSSEGWSYILSLHQPMKSPTFKLAIHHHGDLESLEFWEGLPSYMKNLAFELYQTECRMNETIVICHSEPGAWNPPLFSTLPCPPTVYQNFKAVIGRTMFETDRVNPEHVNRCNKMDYVWVPTEFHVSTFIESGVDPSKVVKIVQPIDVKFYDPLEYTPLDLASIGTLVLGAPTQNTNSNKFSFLSIFKWEYRKGWDVLLKSYLLEFSGVDEVVLYLLTNPYHSDRDFGNKIVEFVENSGISKPVNGWASIYVIDSHIPQIDFPRIYKAADAFVLPSRGEGWGRPIVEAMAMSLPVIATNWSGPTEYLTEENSYPLPVERMSEVKEGPFKGHLWAEPSVSELQVLMRHVMNNVEEATARGNKAREDMIKRFSPEIVANVLVEQIKITLENSHRH